VEFPVSDSGRVHRDSETGAIGLPKPEKLCPPKPWSSELWYQEVLGWLAKYLK